MAKRNLKISGHDGLALQFWLATDSIQGADADIAAARQLSNILYRRQGPPADMEQVEAYLLRRQVDGEDGTIRRLAKTLRIYLFGATPEDKAAIQKRAGLKAAQTKAAKKLVEKAEEAGHPISMDAARAWIGGAR